MDKKITTSDYNDLSKELIEDLMAAFRYMENDIEEYFNNPENHNKTPDDFIISILEKI